MYVFILKYANWWKWMINIVNIIFSMSIYVTLLAMIRIINSLSLSGSYFGKWHERISIAYIAALGPICVHRRTTFFDKRWTRDPFNPLLFTYQRGSEILKAPLRGHILKRVHHLSIVYPLCRAVPQLKVRHYYFTSNRLWAKKLFC